VNTTVADLDDTEVFNAAVNVTTRPDAPVLGDTVNHELSEVADHDD
jgi:hypothetical protein